MRLTVAPGLRRSVLESSHCWCWHSGAKWHFENASDVKEDVPVLSAHWPFCPCACVYVGKSPARLSTKEQSGGWGAVTSCPDPACTSRERTKRGWVKLARVGYVLTCSGWVCLNFGTFWLISRHSPHNTHPTPPHVQMSVLPGATGWCKEDILLNTEFN